MKIDFISQEYKKLKDHCGLRIWKKPVEGHQYAIGVDVAEGVGGDASCCQVLDCSNGYHVASYWSNAVDIDTYACQVYKLGNYYNKATVCPEVNNHGHALVALLGGSAGSLAYPYLYKRIVFDEYTQKRGTQIGFRTTVSTKPRIIENLKSALRDGEIITQDKDTIEELCNFVRDVRTGKMAAAGNSKDDRVMALALAFEQYRITKENAQVSRGGTENYFQKYDEMTGFPL